MPAFLLKIAGDCVPEFCTACMLVFYFDRANRTHLMSVASEMLVQGHSTLSSTFSSQQASEQFFLTVLQDCANCWDERLTSPLKTRIGGVCAQILFVS
jgi:hypothetical protein